MKINFVISVIVLSVMLFVSSVSAGIDFKCTSTSPPKPNVYDGGNKWKITFYNDSTGTHNKWATQEICFLPYTVVGSSIQGIWYSTSFPDWNGRYYQEGDEVKMTGDYARDVGHDHMTLVHTTCDAAGSMVRRVRGMAFGDWTEWREDGRYGRIIGWGNAKLERTGYRRFPHVFATIPVLAPKPLEKVVPVPKPLEKVVLVPKALEKLEYEMLDISSCLPDRLTVKGDIATSPGQSELESLDDYRRRTGVE